MLMTLFIYEQIVLTTTLVMIVDRDVTVEMDHVIKLQGSVLQADVQRDTRETTVI